MIGKIHAMACVAALTLGATFAAAQEEFPARSFRIVVPFAAGGPSDVIARVLGDGLRSATGQSSAVENKTGGGGTIAMTEVLSRPRDGYTLHLCSYIDANNTVVYKKAPYTLADIGPVALVSKSYYAFTIANHVPANSLDEFIRYAKTRDGGLNYGRVGAGGITELLVKQFEHLAGFKSTGVTFRATTESMQEMLGGRLDFVIGPLSTSMPLQEAGKVKVLAVTSAERLATAPGVPTFVEQKIGIENYGWWGICVAAGVPAPIIATLNRHVVGVVKSDSFGAVMERNGMVAASSTAGEMGDLQRRTAADTARLLEDVGIPKLD